MCINLGADIDHQDKSANTALKIARKKGFNDIEELITMNLLKTEVGKRIEETTDDLRRKQGVTKNFYLFLDEVFAAKAAEMQEVGGKKELLTTSMSKTFLNALGENLKAEVLEVILRI